jgi:hypothetical protein
MVMINNIMHLSSVPGNSVHRCVLSKLALLLC